MAGDWIKMESNTPEKEEVLAITARMGWDDADLTVGKLFRLWRWFDQHTVDGNAARVTPALLDRIVGVSGFCAAVQEVGWLAITDGGISLPGFDRHNGATAKSRALTAKRVAKHKSNGQGNDTTNAASVSGALPREEKRREENTSSLRSEDTPPTKPARKQQIDRPVDVDPDVWVSFLAVRKAKRAPVTDLAMLGIRREAVAAGISLNAALTVCCERGWAGFKAEWYSSPPAQAGHYRESFRERDERLARERMDEFLGRSQDQQVIDVTPTNPELSYEPTNPLD